MRVGFGFDAHAFAAERPLVIGGVELPSDAGLAGHSDADVLSHAIGDALLGASGLGDLGAMFPDSEEWKGAVSLDILGRVAATLTENGWSIVNIDSTIVAEAPRMAPHRPQMQANIAGALGIDIDSLSIKATSSDGLGFTGRSEGIAAYAVALIDRLER